MQKLVHRQLEPYGISLVNYLMPRPTSVTINLDEIQLKADAWQLMMSGVTATPTGTSIQAQVIQIESASILLTAAGNSQAPVLAEVLSLLQETIDLVPSSGSIQSLDICREDCIRGGLDWQKSGGILRLYFHPEGGDATATIQLSKQLPGGVISLYSSGTPLFLATLAATGGADNLKLEGAISFNTTGQVQRGRPLPFMSSRLEGLDAAIRTLRIGFKGETSLDSHLDLESALSGLTGLGEIEADLEWNLALAESNVNANQHHQLGIEILHGSLRVFLKTPVEISIDTPLFDEGSLFISAGSLCLLDSGAIRQSRLSAVCKSTDVSMTTIMDTYVLNASLDDARFQFENFDWSLRTPANVSVMEGTTQLIAGRLDITADNQQLNLDSNSISILGMSPFSLGVHHNLTRSNGQGTFNAVLSASQLSAMADYLSIENLDINKGSVTISSVLDWEIPIGTERQSNFPLTRFEASLTATDLDLTIDSYDLKGGTISADLAGWPVIKSSQPIMMSWRLFNIGVPIRNINIAFDLEATPDKPSIYLSGRSLEANAFGGRLNSSEFDYEVIAGDGNLNLALAQLDLHEILKLQQEELHSTGKISGSVPVQVREGKLSVSLGNIKALQPGGVIQYTPSESVINMLDGNEQLQLVVDTMRDFQYHSLEASLEYSTEGDLIARTSLKGSNPEVENGREIYLNLNLEENLSDLLMSLRLGGDVSRQLSKKASH